MKRLIQLGALAGAGYLLWRMFVPMGPVETVPGEAPPEAGAPTGPEPVSPPAGNPILAAIRARAGAGPLNPHQWNWYFSQVTGKPGPSPDILGYVGLEFSMQPVPLDDWAARMTAAGYL